MASQTSQLGVTKLVLESGFLPWPRAFPIQPKLFHRRKKEEEQKKGQVENRKENVTGNQRHVDGLENPGEYQCMQRQTIATDYC